MMYMHGNEKTYNKHVYTAYVHAQRFLNMYMSAETYTMYIQCIYKFIMMVRNVYTWYKHDYFTSLYVHVYSMYIQTCKCIDIFMVCLSPSMQQTLYRHVYTLYIHVYVIWSGFQMHMLHMLQMDYIQITYELHTS